MAIVLYKCDTCKREIEKVQNPRGLEVVGRCVVTLGCRGKLYQKDLLEDFSRASLPPDVVGLDNYQQRRVLYNHTQQRDELEWTIEHNLGSNPVISVFIDQPTNDDPNARIEVKPQDVITVSSDVVRVVFSTPQSGIAQLVARSSDPQLFQPTEVVDTDVVVVPVTNGSLLTIATDLSTDLNEPTTLRIQVTFNTPTGLSIPFTYIVDDTPSSQSPWSSTDNVLIRGKIYRVRSFDPVELAIRSNVIDDGSTMLITGASRDAAANLIEPIEERTIFILLADDPYSEVDRSYTKGVDAFSVSTVSATKQIALQGTELYATDASVQTIHPPIRSL